MNFFKRTPFLFKRSPLQRNFASTSPSTGYMAKNTYSGLVAGGVVGLITVLFFVDDLSLDTKSTPHMPAHGYMKESHATRARD